MATDRRPSISSLPAKPVLTPTQRRSARRRRARARALGDAIQGTALLPRRPPVPIAATKAHDAGGDVANAFAPLSRPGADTVGVVLADHSVLYVPEHLLRTLSPVLASLLDADPPTPSIRLSDPYATRPVLLYLLSLLTPSSLYPLPPPSLSFPIPMPPPQTVLLPSILFALAYSSPLLASALAPLLTAAIHTQSLPPSEIFLLAAQGGRATLHVCTQVISEWTPVWVRRAKGWGWATDLMPLDGSGGFAPSEMGREMWEGVPREYMFALSRVQKGWETQWERARAWEQIVRAELGEQ